MNVTVQGYSRGFNTQPPKGGWNSGSVNFGAIPCFNTQPPEGGWGGGNSGGGGQDGFNTQPPEGGWAVGVPCGVYFWRFQHTAA